jgi:hypothetical protein
LRDTSIKLLIKSSSTQSREQLDVFLFDTATVAAAAVAAAL